MIVRTSALYLLIFFCLLLALDAGAYAFLAREYASFLQPALDTPEGKAGMANALRHVALTIAMLDVPLLVAFGAASYVLARLTLAPIFAARERERVFASDVAHELRSPLAAIAATAQAARVNAAPESCEAFADISTHALDASAIVTDLLTLARRPGANVLQCEPLDLASVIARSARDVSAVARDRGVTLESAPRSAIVIGDERRLRELTRNLLENAIRHARSRVTVASSRNGRRCDIVVEDDGEGVPPDDRERIFERFYRRAQDDSGTGLGLAIVRWIAHAHAGSVAVTQSSAGGARFVASLPAYVADRSTPSQV